MKYVALLRGINVGGNHEVPMAELRNCFDSLGFSAVKTYINSGNVVFESAAAPSSDDVAAALERCFGFVIPTIILPGPDILRIAKELPEGWLNDDAQKTDVLYLFPEADSRATLEVIGIKPEIETFIYTPGALLCNISRLHQQKGSLHKMVGTGLYKMVTIRNCNTARKLAEMVS